MHTPTEDLPYFFLASTSAGAHKGYHFKELSTQSFYVIDIRRLASASDPIAEFNRSLTKLPRIADSASSHLLYASPQAVQKTIDTLGLENHPPRTLETIPSYLTPSVDGLIAHLDHSVQLRVKNIPKKEITAAIESKKAAVGTSRNSVQWGH